MDGVHGWMDLRATGSGNATYPPHHPDTSFTFPFHFFRKNCIISNWLQADAVRMTAHAGEKNAGVV